MVEQRAADEVGQQVAAEVADVGEAVDGRSAGVHPDPAGLERLDRLDLAAERVAKAEHRTSSWARGWTPMLPALTIPASSRCMTQRPRGPVPSFPRRCGPARPHSVPGTSEGSRGKRPYTPRDAPSDRPRRARHAARVMRRDDRSRTGSAGPDPDRGADDARSRRAERRGQRGHHGTAVRVADDLSTPTSSCGRRWPSRGASTTADGGSTFHLRPDLTFSDGSPLRASDVVRSWLRLIDPAAPSPLASIALDIAGAEAYLRGQNPDPGAVGLHADDGAERARGRSRPARHRLRRRSSPARRSGSSRPASVATARPCCPAPASWPAAATC